MVLLHSIFPAITSLLAYKGKAYKCQSLRTVLTKPRYRYGLTDISIEVKGVSPTIGDHLFMKSLVSAIYTDPISVERYRANFICSKLLISYGRQGGKADLIFVMASIPKRSEVHIRFTKSEPKKPVWIDMLTGKRVRFKKDKAKPPFVNLPIDTMKPIA